MRGAEKWFPLVTLIAIFYLAFTGVVAVPLSEVKWGVGAETSALLFGALLALAVINVLLARFLLLPAVIARPQARKDRVVVIGYAHPLAAVVYGPLISIFTAQGLLTLPFAAVALCGWVMVWSYLRGWAEGGEPSAG